MSHSHYSDPDPTAPSAPQTVSLTLPDLAVDLTTDRGVFSREAVDPGTRLLLLEAPAPPDRGHLLDLGCGYGPIAVTLARRSPRATVWAVDVNRRALALAAVNAQKAGVLNVRIAEPDQVPDDVRFAAIWSNPPVRVGKALLHEMLLRWLPRLESGSEAAAILVVQRHLGADSLTRWLNESGHPTTRLLSRAGYRLLSVQNEGSQ